MRKIFGVAIIGFALGFMLNTFIFTFTIFRASVHESFTTMLIGTGFFTGLLGAITANIIQYFFEKGWSQIARGVLMGVSLYFGLMMLSLLFPSLFGLGFIFSLPGTILFTIIEPFFANRTLVLEDHPSIGYLMVTSSWFTYAFVGAIITYLISRKKTEAKE